MRRSMVGVFALALAFGGAAPIRAYEGTYCTFEFEATLAPGLSMSGSSGTHSGSGPLTCEGLINGEQPTGTGTIGDAGDYGTKDPDTCATGGEGTGVDTLRLPTAGGIETVVSEFTFTYGDLSTRGGIVAGKFEGSRFTGTFDFTPTEGDCITAPVTKAKVSGEGFLRG